jgi:hypothetical protein
MQVGIRIVDQVTTFLCRILPATYEFIFALRHYQNSRAKTSAQNIHALPTGFSSYAQSGLSALFALYFLKWQGGL